MRGHRKFYIHDIPNKTVITDLTLDQVKGIYLQFIKDRNELNFEIFEYSYLDGFKDLLILDSEKSITESFTVYNKTYVVFEGR